MRLRRKKYFIIGAVLVMFLLPFASHAQLPIPLPPSLSQLLNPFGSQFQSQSGWMVPNSFGLPRGTIRSIVVGILGWLLGIFGFIGIIGFTVSGIMYLISAGSTEMVEKAKKGMIYSLIGIVVGLSGFVLIQAINALLSGYSSTF